jgi:hypothetical protein
VWVELQEEIDARQAVLTRQAGVAAAGERVRACLERDDIGQAAAELDAARAKYPGEALWTALQAGIDARLVEIEETRGRAEVLLEQGRPEDALALIERLSEHPHLGELITRARQALDLQRRREARDRARDRLLAIQREIETEPRKRKRKQLDREAQGVAAGYSEDQEMATLAAGVHSRVEAARPGTEKPTPWKLIGGAVAAAAVVGAVLVWHNKPVTPDPVSAPKGTFPTPTATIPIEIRTDPPGAALSVAGRSCVTPDCRFDVAPGSYQVDAQLQGYEPKQQTVVFDSLNRTTVLTLQPLPPPTAPSQATLTLVVQTELPDVLVYVDGSPRRRTDQAGSVTLALEARDHTVRVERHGYETPAAKQVTIAAGARQIVAFSLNPQKARLELAGAPADLEVRLDGKPLGRTDGSPSYLFPAPVQSGDHTLSVVRGLLQGRQGSAAKALSEHFDPGQPVRVSWKPDPALPPLPNPGPTVVKIPPPTPEDIAEQDWKKVRDTSDPAQLRDFRKMHPNAHAADAESALERLAWSNTKKDSLESLRAYLRDFRGGVHAAEAESQIADLLWKGVDQAKIEQVRKFLEEHPKGPRAVEAQRVIDLFNAKLDVLRKQILDVLTSLNVAFAKKQETEVKQLWPDKTSRGRILESLRLPGQEMSLEALEEPKLQGDTANVRCTLHTKLPRPRDQIAILSLHYGGGRWVLAYLNVIQ